MLKKGKENICKKCEYKKECYHTNKPMLFCIQLKRNPKRNSLKIEKN